MTTLADWVYDAGFVFVGFLLAIAWDVIKQWRDDASDRKRIVGLVRAEVRANSEIAKALIAAHERGEIPNMIAFPALEDRAWDVVVGHRGLLHLTDEADAAIWRAHYWVGMLHEASRQRSDVLFAALFPKEPVEKSIADLIDGFCKSYLEGASKVLSFLPSVEKTPVAG